MNIVEFANVLESRFAELGEPDLPEASSCCPLGLVYGEPNDLSPDPGNVAQKTGLPRAFCFGVAEGWDNAPHAGFYVQPGGHAERQHYYQGYAHGRNARRRWLEEHPRPFQNKPSA